MTTNWTKRFRNFFLIGLCMVTIISACSTRKPDVNSTTTKPPNNVTRVTKNPQNIDSFDGALEVLESKILSKISQETVLIPDAVAASADFAQLRTYGRFNSDRLGQLQKQYPNTKTLSCPQ